MGNMLRDLRHAARGLSRSPGFTAVALIVLAVGVGANTAVFSVVYNVLLKPLNYRDPGRLVVALHHGSSAVSPADYLDYKAQTSAFENMEAAQSWGGAIETRDRAEVTSGLKVTAGLLSMLGVAPARGRLFRAGEDQPGAAPVIVISHKLWQSQFGGDPSIVGRTIFVAAHPYTVVGVMPATFQFAPFWATQAQMWVPFNMADRIQDRGGRSIRVFARLKEGVTVDQAQTQMTTVAKRLEALYPRSNAGVSIDVIPLQQKVTGPVRPTLLILLATVALVLMIACANIANLLLTRAIGRRREIAVRVAIGAGPWHLIRQLATESLLVSSLGGMLGILVAAWSLALLSRLLPLGSLPRMGEIAIDPLVIAFAVAASLLTGLVSGLFPAIESSSIDVNENLKQGARGSAGGSQRSARGFLITAEISLALVLLVCAGLMIRTLLQLNAVDAGFNPNRLLTVDVFAPPTVETPEKRLARFERVSTALAAIPAVQRVSAINHLPISGDVWTFDYAIPGRPAPAPGHEPSAVYRVVRPGYFEAMEIPLLRGRGIGREDTAQSAPVVVINETLARRQWPGKNPLGETLEITNVPKADARADQPPGRFTIVGVSANVRQSDWTAPPDDEFYLPYLQHADGWDQNHQAFVLRTGVDPTALLAAVDKSIRDVDSHLALSDLMPMEQIISDKLWRSKLSAWLLGSFAAIALILAAVGIYGVISYSVRQRTQEIGIRIALGASRRDVLLLSLGESMGPVLAGVGIGLGLALLAARWLSTLLYGVKPADPVTFACVVAGLVIISCGATLIPTWKATRMDVLSALRNE